MALSHSVLTVSRRIPARRASCVCMSCASLFTRYHSTSAPSVRSAVKRHDEFDVGDLSLNTFDLGSSNSYSSSYPEEWSFPSNPSQNGAVTRSLNHNAHNTGTNARITHQPQPSEPLNTYMGSGMDAMFSDVPLGSPSSTMPQWNSGKSESLFDNSHSTSSQSHWGTTNSQVDSAKKSAWDFNVKSPPAFTNDSTSSQSQWGPSNNSQWGTNSNSQWGTNSNSQWGTNSNSQWGTNNNSQLGTNSKSQSWGTNNKSQWGTSDVSPWDGGSLNGKSESLFNSSSSSSQSHWDTNNKSQWDSWGTPTGSQSSTQTNKTDDFSWANFSYQPTTSSQSSSSTTPLSTYDPLWSSNSLSTYDSSRSPKDKYKNPWVPTQPYPEPSADFADLDSSMWGAPPSNSNQPTLSEKIFGSSSDTALTQQLFDKANKWDQRPLFPKDGPLFSSDSDNLSQSLDSLNNWEKLINPQFFSEPGIGVGRAKPKPKSAGRPKPQVNRGLDFSKSLPIAPKGKKDRINELQPQAAPMSFNFSLDNFPKHLDHRTASLRGQKAPEKAAAPLTAEQIATRNTRQKAEQEARLQSMAEEAQLAAKREEFMENAKKASEEVKKPKPCFLPLRATVQQLSKIFSRKVEDILAAGTELDLRKLKRASSRVKQQTAELLALHFNLPVVLEQRVERDVYPRADLADDAPERPPLVCVMGHVDHGKTTLIDIIRKTQVASAESGGITQSIGAFSVTLDNPGQLTLFDTPGHAAFKSMRARGASMVDVVILAVAANDGVMPQTIESVKMARRAGVPIVVALTKCDVSSAKPQRVRDQLMKIGLFPEDMGGDVQVCEVSGKTGAGVHDLLDMAHLVGQMQEPRAELEGPAEAVVIESKADRRWGMLANVLVRQGSLNVGDWFVAGTQYGKVRKIRDQNNEEVESAGPSQPVTVLGFNGLPVVDSELLVVESEQKAKDVVAYREDRAKRRMMKGQEFWEAEDKFEAKEKCKDLTAIVKGDVSGSVEAIIDYLNMIRAPNNEVTLKVVHSGLGPINTADVKRASGFGAILLGFNVPVMPDARKDAKRLRVDCKLHDVIFHLMDDVSDFMSEQLDEGLELKSIGHAEVLQLFPLNGYNSAGVRPVVNGCKVLDGAITSRSGHAIRVTRGGVVIYEQSEPPLSVRHLKNVVEQIEAGQECGIDLGAFTSCEVGDVIECLERTTIKRRVTVPVMDTERLQSHLSPAMVAVDSDETSLEQSAV
eukprot:342783_1